MFRSRWLPLLLVVVAIACDQTLPSAPSLGGLRRSSIPSVSASDQSADLQVSGEDQVLYESTNLPDYPNTLIADVTINGAVHFDGDPNQGPYFQASGDIGAAGFLVNQTCTLRTTITFRIGGLGSQGACPTAATGDQTLQQTMLINGSGRLELQPSASTRNFCGFTTICWTYSGAMHVKVHPRSAALKLTVDNANPDSGATVTATVTTNPDKIAGIAVPINGDVEWDLPDPGVHCNGGNRVCTFTATQSGTLLVSGIVNGATSSDEVEINVQPKPDSMPHDSTGSDSGPPSCSARLRTSAGARRVGGPLMRTCGDSGSGGGSALQVSVTLAQGTPVPILPSGIDADLRLPDTENGSWPDSAIVIVTVDSAGHGVPGRTVTLTVGATDSGGTGSDSAYGHVHLRSDSPKPAGRATPLSTPVTDSFGTAVFVFHPPSTSGPVWAVASVGRTGSEPLDIEIGIPGLVPLDARVSALLIGTTSVHPDNHWVIPRMKLLLDSLADTVYGLYGKAVQYNDASLPLGGRFDLNTDWRQPHTEHEVGRDIDFRTKDTWDQPHQDAIRFLWEDLGGSVHDETGSNVPHFHLRYRGQP